MNSEALLKQYVDTGLKIPQQQFRRLSSNLKKTYLRKVLIGAQTVSTELDYELAFYNDVQNTTYDFV